MRKYILGAPVDIMFRADALRLISNWIEDGTARMKLVVTAYSEFYVQAKRDSDFLRVLRLSDLITPDGVSVLAADKYLESTKGESVVKRFLGGLKIGGEILTGKIGEPVTGVWLFENLTKMAAEKNWKVFLLGGWDNVSERTARILLKRFPELNVAYDAGEARVGTDEKRNKEVIEKINKFAPDILFVAYNPIKQEKWLAENRKALKVKVGMGIGGTFNEFLGEFKKAPALMEKMGLKWLWRVIQEPRRLGRILRAVVIFPWLVFNEK